MSSVWHWTVLSRFLPAGCLVSAGALVSSCDQCDDCNRLGPPALGYLRASALDVLGSPVPGVSIHIDNRLYVTEPQVTGADGAAVLEVSLTVSGSTDTATVTALPPEGYRNPPSQPVTIVADDTVDVGFALQAE